MLKTIELELASPWGSHHRKPLKVDNERPELFWPSFPVPWVLNAKIGCFLWATTRKFVLSKHSSAETFIEFSLHCAFLLGNRYRAKRKMYWNRLKSCSASERLLWALILDLSQRQPKSHFSWRVTFDTWKRLPTWSRWYMLIIFDTELTLGCFASGAGAQQVVSSLSGICTYTLLRLVHIIGGLL